MLWAIEQSLISFIVSFECRKQCLTNVKINKCLIDVCFKEGRKHILSAIANESTPSYGTVIVQWEAILRFKAKLALNWLWSFTVHYEMRSVGEAAEFSKELIPKLVIIRDDLLLLLLTRFFSTVLHITLYQNTLQFFF